MNFSRMVKKNYSLYVEIVKKKLKQMDQTSSLWTIVLIQKMFVELFICLNKV